MTTRECCICLEDIALDDFRFVHLGCCRAGTMCRPCYDQLSRSKCPVCNQWFTPNSQRRESLLYTAPFQLEQGEPEPVVVESQVNPINAAFDAMVEMVGNQTAIINWRAQVYSLPNTRGTHDLCVPLKLGLDFSDIRLSSRISNLQRPYEVEFYLNGVLLWKDSSRFQANLMHGAVCVFPGRTITHSHLVMIVRDWDNESPSHLDFQYRALRLERQHDHLAMIWPSVCRYNNRECLRVQHNNYLRVMNGMAGLSKSCICHKFAYGQDEVRSYRLLPRLDSPSTGLLDAQALEAIMLLSDSTIESAPDRVVWPVEIPFPEGQLELVIPHFRGADILSNLRVVGPNQLVEAHLVLCDTPDAINLEVLREPMWLNILKYGLLNQAHIISTFTIRLTEPAQSCVVHFDLAVLGSDQRRMLVNMSDVVDYRTFLGNQYAVDDGDNQESGDQYAVDDGDNQVSQESVEGE